MSEVLHDAIAHHIEALGELKGSVVGFDMDGGACHPCLPETGAPVARLKSSGVADKVRPGFQSHRGRWEDADDMGGPSRPLDFVAATVMLWRRTRARNRTKSS